jgi:hypothetical protein
MDEVLFVKVLLQNVSLGRCLNSSCFIFHFLQEYRSMQRFLRGFLVFVCIGALWSVVAVSPPSVQAQNGGLFEALYVFKFCSFVKFPADRMSGDFVIAVLGAPDFAAQLEKTVAGKSVGAQAIKVRAINDISEASGSHVIYVPDAQAKKLPKIIEAVRGKSTLVVSKGAGMAKDGSHINIFTNGDKKFEINRTAAEGAGLKLSADLLKLAVVL